MITQRKSSAIAAAAAVTAAAAAASVFAVTANGQTASRTIEVTQVDEAFAFVDVAPKGGPGKPFTQGDAFVIGGKLLAGTKPAAAKAVGKSNLVCTTTQPGRRGGSVCEGTLVLPAGEITFTGYNTVADVPSTVFAVTGGTGSYVGARGTVSAKNAKGGRTAITVRI